MTVNLMLKLKVLKPSISFSLETATRSWDSLHFHHLCVFFSNTMAQGVGDVEPVSFANTTASHADFRTSVVPKLAHAHQAVLKAELEVILEAILVCSGCTRDELTDAEQAPALVHFGSGFCKLLLA